jgi:predicted ArsR family transcriptional regulator
MESRTELERRIAGIAALDQPVRRDLYRLLADGAWHSRDDAERTSGRQGPGAGRPSKLYRLAADELSASVPERHYDLAGSLLATAVADSTRTGRPVRDCLREAAHAAGHQLGEEARAATTSARRSDERRAAVMAVLAQHGYEPELGQHKEIALANCPFHRLAEQQRDLVCGMNLDFLAGLLEGLEPTDHLTARLDPAPGYCCVRIAAS